MTPYGRVTSKIINPKTFENIETFDPFFSEKNYNYAKSLNISEEEAYGRYKHFLIDEGDLLIASSGIKVDYFDKKITFARKEHLPLCMNTSTIRFKVIDKAVLDINYLRHFLASRYFPRIVFPGLPRSGSIFCAKGCPSTTF